MPPYRWPERTVEAGRGGVGCAGSNCMQQLRGRGSKRSASPLVPQASGPHLDGHIVLVNLKVGPPQHPQVLARHHALLLHRHVAGAGCCSCIASGLLLLRLLLRWGSVGAHAGVLSIQALAAAAAAAHMCSCCGEGQAGGNHCRRRQRNSLYLSLQTLCCQVNA